jgi:pyruvate kinase
VPCLIGEKTNTDELFEAALDAARSTGIVKTGDTVVITAGVPLGVSGTTNLMKVSKA